MIRAFCGDGLRGVVEGEDAEVEGRPVAVRHLENVVCRAVCDRFGLAHEAVGEGAGGSWLLQDVLIRLGDDDGGIDGQDGAETWVQKGHLVVERDAKVDSKR